MNYFIIKINHGISKSNLTHNCKFIILYQYVKKKFNQYSEYGL